MIEFAASLVLALATPSLPPTATATARADDMQRCETQAGRGDRRDIRCALDASAADRRLRFKAYFAGSHDDTTLSMTPTLDGAPLACEPGSRTYLEGEDGDVALECRFTLAPGAGKTLQVALAWYHARYTSFELVLE